MLSILPDRCEVIYVGKKTNQPALSAGKINQLLIKKAQKGKIVARLKEDDPFSLASGEEEALALAKERVPFEIIPGINSLSAAAAYAGIPLSAGKINSTLAFIGPLEEKKKNFRFAWDKLVDIETLIFLLEEKNLEFMVKKLLEAGKESGSKAALIQNGTTAKQKTIYGSLKEIISLTGKKQIELPAIFIVGEVTKLRSKLNWFEKKPLFGKTVLITLPPEQSRSLEEKLEELGARVIKLPTVMIADPDDYTPLDSQIDNLSLFNWIIFTNPSGVEYFFKRLFKKNKDLRDLKGILITVVNSATKEKLESFHLKADFMPTDFSNQAIINGLKHKSISGQRILLPCSQLADEDLSNGLRQLGAEVREVCAYRVVKPEIETKAVKNKNIDMIIFNHPCAVNNFTNSFSSLKQIKENFSKTKIASVGPLTSKAIRQSGLKVYTQAKEHSIDGLIKAIIKSSGKKN